MSTEEFWQQYVREIDTELIASTSDDERVSTTLIAKTEPRAAEMRYIRTPPGGGSPRGPHTHVWEQIFYILEGTMEIEVTGQHRTVGPGSVVVFPEGIEHRNWNASDRPTVHLAVNIPRNSRVEVAGQ
jgi:quercetin dioxygenase-like cupin family protein